MQTGPEVTGDGQVRISDRARDEMDRAAENLGRLVDRLEELVRERPAAALFVALGAGFLVGRLLRRR